MEISLEHIKDSATPNTFHVAFYSATERCLLPNPNVTGLTFTDASGNNAEEWRTRYRASQPLDDFVMNPGARIAFDLYANINTDSAEHRWVIDLPTGEYSVYYSYRVEQDTEWYDFLAKRSRFAALTPIWRGVIQSNTIRFGVTDAKTENTK
ncbi:hypothetical protein SH467x_003665 [Pirellulaceae bacterium SH467]